MLKSLIWLYGDCMKNSLKSNYFSYKRVCIDLGQWLKMGVQNNELVTVN